MTDDVIRFLRFWPLRSLLFRFFPSSVAQVFYFFVWGGVVLFHREMDFSDRFFFFLCNLKNDFSDLPRHTRSLLSRGGSAVIFGGCCCCCCCCCCCFQLNFWGSSGLAGRGLSESTTTTWNCWIFEMTSRWPPTAPATGGGGHPGHDYFSVFIACLSAVLTTQWPSKMAGGQRLDCLLCRCRGPPSPRRPGRSRVPRSMVLTHTHTHTHTHTDLLLCVTEPAVGG